MLKQKSGFTVDVTPRKILLTYEDYELVCEALAGISRKSRIGISKLTEKRKKLMRRIVTDWKKEDEVEDGRRN